MPVQLVSLPRRRRDASIAEASVAVDAARRRVVVLGNPNTGKTTLFNRIAGTNLRVGNYPGVTVEGAQASVRLPDGTPVDLVDLPGCYSLSARGAEEQIAIDALMGWGGFPAPDAALLVLDCTQLERNLYLALQVMDLGIPAILALNMADEARAAGTELDLARISAALGMPAVPVVARDGEGVDALVHALGALLGRLDRLPPAPAPPALPPALAEAADALAGEAAGALPLPPRARGPGAPRALALWALLSVGDGDELRHVPDGLRAAVERTRASLAAAGVDVDDALASSRYAFIDGLAASALRRDNSVLRAWTRRLDGVLVHPLWGFAVFLLLMSAVFQGLFSWSEPLIAGVEAIFAWMATGARALLPPGIVADFVADALIAGLGSVLVFLPQILLLFLVIGLMEDSGYMSRVAYLMDRIMKAIGLHGRAFVPMMSGYACAVPAILATRTLERQRDRILTMMVVPLMTCSARLPVYTLIIGAVIPAGMVAGFVPVQGLVMAGMYLFATVTTLLVAAVLARTVVKGERVPLILELPPYRLPKASTVLRMIWDRSRLFLTEAGTVILACTVVLWALLSFPRNDAALDGVKTSHLTLGAGAEVSEAQAAGGDAAAKEAAAAAVRLRDSFGGRLGRVIEPAIEPLGFDWKIGIGLVGAFAAREVFVATLGVVYGAGAGVDEQSDSLRERIRAERKPDGTPRYTPLVGVSLLVFFALSAQCMSTLAAVRRETRSWRWPLFLFSYMTALAWLASFVVYQGGRVLGLG